MPLGPYLICMSQTRNILLSPAAILTFFFIGILLASIVLLAAGSWIGVVAGPPALLAGLVFADRIGRDSH